MFWYQTRMCHMWNTSHSVPPLVLELYHFLNNSILSWLLWFYYWFYFFEDLLVVQVFHSLILYVEKLLFEWPKHCDDLLLSFIYNLYIEVQYVFVLILCVIDSTHSSLFQCCCSLRSFQLLFDFQRLFWFFFQFLLFFA